VHFYKTREKLSVMLSLSERRFIKDGVDDNMRLDGRERMDFRSFTVETDVVTQANGSARVRLHDTDVLVGVKLELGETEFKAPDEGIIKLAVQCVGDFLGEQRVRYIEHTLSEILACGLDRTKLCVKSGKCCWVVFVDCLVLHSGGNVLDALGFAVVAALQDTMVPGIEVLEETGETDLPAGAFEVIVSDDQDELVRFEGATELPLCLSFAVFDQHNAIVVDPALNEESCMQTLLTFSVNREGHIFSIHKQGFLGLNASQLKLLQVFAGRLGRQIHIKLASALEAESNVREGRV